MCSGIDGGRPFFVLRSISRANAARADTSMRADTRRSSISAWTVAAASASSRLGAGDASGAARAPNALASMLAMPVPAVLENAEASVCRRLGRSRCAAASASTSTVRATSTARRSGATLSADAHSMRAGEVGARWRDGASGAGAPSVLARRQSRRSSRKRATLRTCAVNVSDVARNWLSASGDSGNGIGSRSAIQNVVHGAPLADVSVAGAVARRVYSASPFQKNPMSSSPLTTIGSSHTLKSE